MMMMLRLRIISLDFITISMHFICIFYSKELIKVENSLKIKKNKIV